MPKTEERYTHIEAGHAASEYDNDAAYGRFRGRSLIDDMGNAVSAAMRHKLTSAILLLMLVAGFVGALATFWP